MEFGKFVEFKKSKADSTFWQSANVIEMTHSVNKNTAIAPSSAFTPLRYLDGIMVYDSEKDRTRQQNVSTLFSDLTPMLVLHSRMQICGKEPRELVSGNVIPPESPVAWMISGRKYFLVTVMIRVSFSRAESWV